MQEEATSLPAREPLRNTRHSIVARSWEGREAKDAKVKKRDLSFIEVMFVSYIGFIYKEMCNFP